MENVWKQVNKSANKKPNASATQEQVNIQRINANAVKKENANGIVLIVSVIRKSPQKCAPDMVNVIVKMEETAKLVRYRKKFPSIYWFKNPKCNILN